jgi:hypothetical protein
MRSQHCFADEIFAGDQFDMLLLADAFVRYGAPHLDVVVQRFRYLPHAHNLLHYT